MADEDDFSYDLAMPFVSLKSEGGPHDDESYVCGFEMGQLDARLATVGAFLDTYSWSIHATNRAQADLIAMHHGFISDFVECHENQDWLHVTFQRPEEHSHDDL